MLTRTHLTLTLAALLSTAATACVIVDDTTTSSGTGGQGTGGNASSTGGSGTGGSGNTSTTSTGGGGTGGGTTCVGPDGTGTTVDACADMEASQFSTCPSTGAPPPATGACVRGNDLFTAGAWEDMLACLSQIPATQEDACDEPKASDLVTACLGDMYNDACVQQPIVDECDSILAQCDGAGQPGYDVDGCKADLNPFSAAGVAEYEDCFANAPADITCADIHAYCIDLLFQ